MNNSGMCDSSKSLDGPATESENNERNRSYEGTLKQDTGIFCLSERLADVWFSFKNSSDKIPAHKILLSIRSEVFEAMFYGPMAESCDTVIIEDIEMATMTLLLRYIYTDEVDLDGTHVMECLYAAKKYALHALVVRCLQFLEEAINVQSSCAIHEQAIFYGENGLQAKCFNYIVENSDGVFKSEGFRTLSYKSLFQIIECDHLASDESVIFRAAKVWAEYQCKEKDLEVTPLNIRSCLGDIIYMIRFPVMTIETFAQQVATTDVLTSEEMLKLYHYLATKSSSPGTTNVGKFSCRRRTVVLRVADTNITHSYEGCVILLNTSGPVKLVSVKGDFVTNVIKINASNAGRQDVDFHVKKDELTLKEPLLVRPHSGNIQMVFHLNEEGASNVWSANVNLTRTVKVTTINVRRVPRGLHSIVFDQVL